MTNNEDIIGKKFNRLLILDKSKERRKGLTKYLCQCDCGNTKLIVKSSIVKGLTKSCGCLRIEKVKISNKLNSYTKYKSNEAAKNRLYSTYKRTAESRNLTFDLTLEDFIKLTSDYCYYCGEEPNTICKSNTKSPNYKYNGIDRVNNLKGYEINNCVTCCKTCNFAKGTKNLIEFGLYLEKIKEFTGGIWEDKRGFFSRGSIYGFL